MVLGIDFFGTLVYDVSMSTDLRLRRGVVDRIREMKSDGMKVVIIVYGVEGVIVDQVTDFLDRSDINHDGVLSLPVMWDIHVGSKGVHKDSISSYTKLDAGFTGNKVRRIGDRVIKKAKTTQNEARWYELAKAGGLNVPEVFYSDGDTLILEHIDAESTPDIHRVLQALTIMSNMPPTSELTFDAYIKRIKRHLESNDGMIEGNKLLERLSNITPPSTFNHGDFSTYNLLEKGQTLYLIDPIMNDDVFQSHWIDISKYLFTTLFYRIDHDAYEIAKYVLCREFKVDPEAVNILVASESVRVANMKKGLADISNNLIDAL